MKYAVLIGDGMADDPIPELGGKTPLEYSDTPCMDELSLKGEGGCVETIPEGYPPGSGVACMSIFGYDPSVHFSGRGPLEAGGMGINVGEDEFAFRCNVVTADTDRGVMVDYSSGHISTEESRALIENIDRAFSSEPGFRFYPGVGYRHLFTVKKNVIGGIPECTPPHDITGEPYEEHLPAGQGAEFLKDLMKRSVPLMSRHPVNTAREKAGLRQANMLWFWSGGVKPGFTPLGERFSLSGGVISAVDLIRGIAFYAGAEYIDVPGITGYYDTNYEGKAEYGIEAFSRNDIVFIHVEAPDEASHNGDTDEKIRAIENFDRLVVSPVYDYLKGQNGFRILVMPDHYTPLSMGTHRRGPVPAAVCGTGIEQDDVTSFSENKARKGALTGMKGHTLLEYMVRQP